MNKKDYFSYFWEKRWEKNCGYVLSSQLLREDLINARIRYDFLLDKDSALFIRDVFPKQLNREDFWAAVVCDMGKLKNGKWKDSEGEGARFREHILLDFCANGTEEEKERCSVELLEMGYRPVGQAPPPEIKAEKITKQYHFEEV